MVEKMRNYVIHSRKYSTVYNVPIFMKLTVAQYRYVNLCQKFPIMSRIMESSARNSLRTYLNYGCRSEYFHLTQDFLDFFL
jgi:hypothetical protein